MVLPVILFLSSLQQQKLLRNYEGHDLKENT